MLLLGKWNLFARLICSGDTGKVGFERLLMSNEGIRSSFDAGAYGMCPGETRHLLIPSKYAYGEKGTGDGVIPPNADLGTYRRLFPVLPRDLLVSWSSSPSRA